MRAVLRTFRSSLQRWRANQRGAMALNFAILLVPLLAAVGMSIDGSRFLLTRYYLQSAVDASALAVGTVYADDATLDALADRYVEKNFVSTDATLKDIDLVVTADTVKVSGKATVKTLFMNVLHVSSVDVAASTEVKRAGGGLAVTLVLDNTGSMWGGSPSKISSLRNASGVLVDAIFDNESEPEDLRVAMVPYAATVNPGAEAQTIVGTHGHGDQDGDDKTAWKGCVMERSGADSIADTPPTTAQWQPFWYPSNADDNDYDIDDPDTITPGGNYDSNNITGPNIGCPTPITPLTNSYEAVSSAVSALTAWNRGGTLGDIGMAWGIRTLSPGLPFDETTEIDPKTGATIWESPRWRKAIVLMTDGDNLFYDVHPSSGAGNSDYTAYGRLGESQANALFGTSDKNAAKRMIDDRLESLCTTAKDQDILIFTVTFGSSVNEDTKSTYQNCATDLGKYFHAPSDSTLQSAFGAIGAELSKLRITK